MSLLLIKIGGPVLGKFRHNGQNVDGHGGGTTAKALEALDKMFSGKKVADDTPTTADERGRLMTELNGHERYLQLTRVNIDDMLLKITRLKGYGTNR